MSGPEEYLDQGGRFLLRRERFRIFFKETLKEIIKGSRRNRKRPPWSKSSSRLLIQSYILQGLQKKVSGKLVKKSGRLSAYQTLRFY